MNKINITFFLTVICVLTFISSLLFIIDIEHFVIVGGLSIIGLIVSLLLLSAEMRKRDR